MQKRKNWHTYKRKYNIQIYENINNNSQTHRQLYKQTGIKIDFTEKQLHLSLAYHFSEDKEARLNELARSLDLHLPARWDIRLYSRSPISANYQVSAGSSSATV